MLNLSKEKIFISLVIITLVALVIGNVKTFATEEVANTANNTAGTVITATRLTNNTTAAVNNTTENSTTNGATNNVVNNTNTSNNVVNNTNSTRNSSSYVNSSLPYAGTSSSIVFIVIALGASAIYAYKKVKEYNG